MGDPNVWELDHYAYKSSLGIYQQDLCLNLIISKGLKCTYINVQSMTYGIDLRKNPQQFCYNFKGC